MPKVSVIILTFNRAPLLCGAIESVLAQTFQDWELIIVFEAFSNGNYRPRNGPPCGGGARRSIMSGPWSIWIKKNTRGLERNFLRALFYDPSIGTGVSWSRFKNQLYRYLRPYLAILYCLVMSLASKGR